jgi:hypothetical protein
MLTQAAGRRLKYFHDKLPIADVASFYYLKNNLLSKAEI